MMNFKDKLDSNNKKTKDFKYLNKLIHDGDKKIVLDADIVFSNKLLDDNIILDVPRMVIDGNGHTIDGKNKTNIFSVVRRDITLKNITLKNADNRSPADVGVLHSGGTIFNKSQGLKIINVNFISNASNSGGAIYNSEKGEIEIEECFFKNNSADSGCAIYNDGVIKIDNCRIEKSHTGSERYRGSEGSAISNRKGTMEIKNLSCINNFARPIFNQGKAEITDSKFINNKSLENHQTMKITNGLFENNRTAISNHGKLVLENSAVISNTSPTDGGGIFNVGELNLFDVEIANNSSLKNGGGIYNAGEINLTNSKIVMNTAANGGGIYNDISIDLGRINDCIIRDNEPNDRFNPYE